MQTQKIQITLTPQEIAALTMKGKGLGYNATKYIKFLIMKEAYSIVESIPALPLSQDLEKKTLEALKEYGEKKTKRLKNPTEFASL